MKARRALVVPLVALVAVGVGAVVFLAEPPSGTVVRTEQVPPRVDRSCTPDQLTCTSVTHPECWRVVYRGWFRTGSACVDAKSYDRYQPGDRFPARPRSESFPITVVRPASTEPLTTFAEEASMALPTSPRTQPVPPPGPWGPSTDDRRPGDE